TFRVRGADSAGEGALILICRSYHGTREDICGDPQKAECRGLSSVVSRYQLDSNNNLGFNRR
ncbi:MAG: hypothetical protein V4636_04515, partial [Pseudomonadota bacterium]